uniref:Uncharacterized protein n=1 Tax=Meloidogyne enterolobii TaxID=390850 RepID=A0A6V7XWS2_MELEN|nr:unnamed protein product [Meloidogyne enterolobii]
MASSLSFEQLKVTINSSPESALIHKDVEHQFKLLREHISSLDIKTVTQVGYCKQVAPDPRGPPKEEDEWRMSMCHFQILPLNVLASWLLQIQEVLLTKILKFLICQSLNLAGFLLKRKV